MFLCGQPTVTADPLGDHRRGYGRMALQQFTNAWLDPVHSRTRQRASILRWELLVGFGNWLR